MWPLFSAGFLAGVCLLQAAEVLPAPAALAVLFTALFAAAVFAALFYFFPRARLLFPARFRVFAGGGIPRRIMLLAAAFLLGYGYAAARAHWRLQDPLPPEMVWRDIVLEGEVRGLPARQEHRVRFDFFIHRIVSPQEIEINKVARLSRYFPEKKPPFAADIKDGAKLRLAARIRPPRGAVNFHEDGYEKYMLAANVAYAGYVREGRGARLLAAGGGLRESVRARIETAMSPLGAAYVKALALGERGGLDEAQWRALRRTGTAHLVSVSGAHIGLAAFFAGLLANFLCRRSVRVLKIIPAQKAALLAAAAAAIFYAWLAGMGVPVQRALLMLLTLTAAALAGGFSSLGAPLAVAALVVLLWDPWAAVSAGFWLSFAAAGAIVLALAEKKAALPKFLRLQLLLSAISLPLTLWFFNEASLISPLANLAAIPFVAFFALPLSVADVFVPGNFLWRLADAPLVAFSHLLTTAGEWRGAAVTAASSSAAAAVFAAGGALWFLLPLGRTRLLGLLPMAALFFAPVEPPPQTGRAQVTVFDVGQGNAVLIRTQNYALLYDAAPAWRGGDAAQRTLLPHLRAAGISLNTIIVSHDDIDHSGGAARLAREAKPARMLSSLPSSHPAHAIIVNNGGKSEKCLAGQSWSRDGVHFSILHPRAGDYNTGGSDNDRSCVLKVTAADGRAFLLAGDISGKVERRLAAEAAPLRADYLLAAHHGSRFSSTAEFLRAVSPRAALIGVGRNTFGHPHPDALRRARQAGAAVFRTDRHGALRFALGGEGGVLSARAAQKRYWRPPPGADNGGKMR